MKIIQRVTARKRLDERLSALKPVNRFTVPPKGWVRAIRDSLGMSAAQLGLRMGVKPQSVADLEKSEARGTVQLQTLKRAAESLGCTLVYALVPNSSLDETVHTRAREVAREELARIWHSMDLESQNLSNSEKDEQIESYIAKHLRVRDLWERT